MARRLVQSTLLALAVLGCSSASAAAGGWIGAGLISGPGASELRLAVDPAGNATIVWLDSGSLKAAGRAPEGAFSSLGTLGTEASEPDLAVGRSGAVGVTWVQTGAGEGGPEYFVRSARRSGAGPLGDFQSVLPTGTSAVASSPRIDLDNSGNPTVAWLEDAATGTAAAGKVRVATDNPVMYGVPETIPVGGVDGLDMAVDGGGTATIMWQALHCTAGGCEDYKLNAVVRPPGGPRGPTQLLDRTNSDAISPTPSLGSDAAGNAIAVWRVFCGSECPGESGLYVRGASRASGSGTFAAPAYLSTEGGDVSPSPGIAVAPTGEAFASWELHPTGGVAVPQVAVRPPGSSFGPPMTLQSSGSNGGTPAIAAGGGGRALAAFGASPGIIRAAAGGVGGFAAPETISAAISTRPVVGQDAQGHGIAAWLRDGFVEAAIYDPVAPVLEAVQAPAGGRPGEPLGFSAAARDAFTSVASMRWDFGDGSSASGASATHAYGSAGTYSATFTATDAAGNTASATRTVVVSSPAETADRRPPRLGLRAPKRLSRRALLRGLKVKASCSEPCRLNAELLLDGRTAKQLRLAAPKPVRIGRASKRLTKAGSATLTLRPTAKARRRLAHGPVRSVTVRVWGVDRAGNAPKTSPGR